jgi:tRNA pseudouridine38-40 synthase
VRTIRLDVAYDGTEFHGWQAQTGLRTVQGVLEETLTDVLGEPVSVTGAGRTDAGTHARGQVASFTTEARLPTSALVPVLKRHLPADVMVREAAECDAGFNARHSAVARRYAYRLLDRPDVLWQRTAWWPRGQVHPEALRRPSFRSKERTIAPRSRPVDARRAGASAWCTARHGAAGREA